MPVTLHVEAKSLEDALGQLQKVRPAAGQGGEALAEYSDDQLLHELRQRMAKQQMVVRVVPFSSSNDDAAVTQNVEEVSTGETKKKGRGRPKKAEKAEDDAQTQQIEDQPADAQQTDDEGEGPQETQPETETEGSEVEGEITRERLKAALDAYAVEFGGIAATRAMLQEQGGAERTKDIPDDKLAHVIHFAEQAVAEKKAA